MILLIFVAGLALRTLMLLSEKSLWGDEFFSIELAVKPFAQVFMGAIHDVHPPL